MNIRKICQQKNTRIFETIDPPGDAVRAAWTRFLYPANPLPARPRDAPGRDGSGFHERLEGLPAAAKAGPAAKRASPGLSRAAAR
jgi:hypothetical protein